LCSVQQRLALAKVVHHRLAPDSPGYRWLPFCLLESIGLWLVPPAAEDKPVADDKQLEPQVVDEMYVTLAKINLRKCTRSLCVFFESLKEAAAQATPPAVPAPSRLRPSQRRPLSM